ncbi:MAG: sugar phosphate nucleotidyltransferase [Gemmatimonadota bacterium]|nr:sugar phosphate nucleotidyltransferase [Gemmatimonadota bacterium]
MSETRSTAVPRWAVILAGGVGSRFWPASTAARPKQLLPLGAGPSLIRDAWERARRLVGDDRVLVLAGPELVAPFRAAVPELTDARFLLEPVARSTGPVLVRAAAEIERREPGAVMISLHADHLIDPFAALAGTVDRACAAAVRRDSLVCLGVPPVRAETGYGYLETGAERDPGVHAVRCFREKPDAETARAFAADGRHLWNTGIFVWRARDLVAAARLHTRELDAAFPRLDAGDADGFLHLAEPVSVDVGVLERADNVEVAVASFRWDDVGTWEALARTRPADGAGNVAVGVAEVVDGRRNVVWTEEGRVVLFGVDDLVVVRAHGETLVTRRDLAAQLKRLLAALPEREEDGT